MATVKTRTNQNVGNNLLPWPSEVFPLLKREIQKEAALYDATGGRGLSSAAGEEEESTAVTLDDDGENHHRTNVFETFLHLLKGYIGAGMLSLPWAVSQLGVVGGILGIWFMSWWSSYNCYTVVSIKRYMEKTTARDVIDDKNSETGSNITYPDVGEWAYGATFQTYITACIIVQQLAVCTVYVSFVGENLQAVLHYLNLPASHIEVMSMALPVILGLSLIPSLKLLAPVMAVGTVLLLVSLAALGVIVEKEWDSRPAQPPAMDISKVPLALCAIIYSYEGICLILPVESAMQKPSKFGAVFVFTMVTVAMAYVVVAVTCVYTFGNVTSGSLTAFLLENFNNDSSVTAWVNIANAAVSFSVLLTYPLTLFPAVELLGLALERSNSLLANLLRGNAVEKDGDDSSSLDAFEPLPPLPEDDVASMESLPMEHHYGQETTESSPPQVDNEAEEAASASGISSLASMMPKMTLPGDSPQLRALLVLMTYVIAVVVPNVQALISLAGALAGSSTALLIPPLLELAWIEHLEHCEQRAPTSSSSSASISASPHIIRTTMSKRRNSRWTTSGNNYWKEKGKCYVLLVLGAIFMCIGTFASISDIVKIYVGD